MAQPHKFLAEKSSGSEFRTLDTADLRDTDATIGPGAGSSSPGDFAVFVGYDGKTLEPGFVHTQPDGALDGDGTPGDPLGVRTDDITIHKNASNDLEVLGAPAIVITSPTGALDGDGSGSDPLAVRVDGITIGVSASNELEVLAVPATVFVDPAGALDGDGSVGSPLAVLVDTTSIDISGSNRLETVSGGTAVVTAALGALSGNGKTATPLAVLVDGVTVGINASNELEALGGASTISVTDALAGDGSGGDPVRVLVDNETIGIDSNNELQVIAPYIPAGVVRHALGFSDGYLDVQVDNQTIGINSDNELEALNTGSGKIAQVVTLATTAVNSGSTTIPADDTPPLSTEGDEYMTLSITPRFATSTLIIDCVIHGASSAARLIIAALFRDSASEAIAATGITTNSTNQTMAFPLRHMVLAGSTSPTTFKVRVGLSSAGTYTFNGAATARQFGAITKSSMTITEVLA